MEIFDVLLFMWNMFTQAFLLTNDQHWTGSRAGRVTMARRTSYTWKIIFTHFNVLLWVTTVHMIGEYHICEFWHPHILECNLWKTCGLRPWEPRKIPQTWLSTWWLGIVGSTMVRRHQPSAVAKIAKTSVPTKPGSSIGNTGKPLNKTRWSLWKGIFVQTLLQEEDRV